MGLFPLFLKLEGRRCLVVGAGKVGEEKAEGLLRGGAEVRVVAPKATRRMREWARERKIQWRARTYRPRDLEGVYLVVAATPLPKLHEEIYREARRRGILCNVADDPPHCDFFYPSVLRRGALQIAISTSGYSPALAQRLRKELERQFDAEYQEWVEELGEARKELFAMEMLPVARRRKLHRLASRRSFEGFLRRKNRTAKENRK
jgi:precorrin-2 dehydrogenase / sirohydrochlorin ferrochelatase